MEVSCPISAERVNENVVRLIAFLVMLIAIVSAYFNNYWAFLLLTFDFGLRAFSSGNWSPLKFTALKLAKVFKIPQKLTDLAPKKFAASLGFGFSALITAFYLFGYAEISFALTIILIVFAFLESVLAICVGCYFYSFLQLLRKKA